MGWKTIIFKAIRDRKSAEPHNRPDAAVGIYASLRHNRRTYLYRHAPPDRWMGIIIFHNKIINSQLIKGFLCNMQFRQRFWFP